MAGTGWGKVFHPDPPPPGGGWRFSLYFQPGIDSGILTYLPKAPWLGSKVLRLKPRPAPLQGLGSS